MSTFAVRCTTFDLTQVFNFHAREAFLRSRDPGPPLGNARRCAPCAPSAARPAPPRLPPPRAAAGFPSGVTAAPPPAGFASGSARGRSWRRRRGERGAHGAAAVRRPGPAAGAGRRPEEMDKLTIISGCLFLAADIFAIASLANPDWINTGESAGEAAGPRAAAGAEVLRGGAGGGPGCQLWRRAAEGR